MLAQEALEIISLLGGLFSQVRRSFVVQFTVVIHQQHVGDNFSHSLVLPRLYV